MEYLVPFITACLQAPSVKAVALEKAKWLC